MSSHILFIVEGVRTEQNIIRNLEQFFIQDTGKSIIRASYGHNIYKLYDTIHKDTGLGLFGIIQETLSSRSIITEYDQEILDLEDADLISDIYLFFDYDAHTTNASDDKLKAMLKLFNDPMDNGLLCVSYPMVEAIRHISLTPHQLLHPLDDLKNYKSHLTAKNAQQQLVHVLDRYFNWGAYDLAIWSEIINVHLSRANYLTNEQYSFPDDPLSQYVIFDAQLRNNIPSQAIAVLSAFPLMLHEYYGDKLLAKLAVTGEGA